MASSATRAPGAQPDPRRNARGARGPYRTYAAARPLISMEECRTITRKSASNLALAFVLLPKAKRDGMSALYAFCREVDDVADNESIPVKKRHEQLAAWRAHVRRACGEETPHFQFNRKLQAVI